MGREETLVNQEVELGFRHFFNGVLTNANQIFDVRIQDPDTFEVVHVIPASQIQNPETGVYTVTVPPDVLNRPGN